MLTNSESACAMLRGRKEAAARSTGAFLSGEGRMNLFGSRSKKREAPRMSADHVSGQIQEIQKSLDTLEKRSASRMAHDRPRSPRGGRSRPACSFCGPSWLIRTPSRANAAGREKHVEFKLGEQEKAARAKLRAKDRRGAPLAPPRRHMRMQSLTEAGPARVQGPFSRSSARRCTRARSTRSRAHA